MAFRVDIEYDPTVETDGSVLLTARVINTDTDEEVTLFVTYVWTFVGTGTMSGQNTAMATYEAEGFGVDDVPATIYITCTATISNITPDADTISTMTLNDLGITGIDVNVLVETNIDGDYLYNGDNDSFEPGSDTNFYTTDTLNLYQIQWRELSTGSYELVLNRDPLDGMTTMRTYWVADGNLSTKAVYIIAPDGTVLEIDDAFASTSDVTDESITFTIHTADSHEIDTMNRIMDGDRFVLGVADKDTLMGIEATASRTVHVNVLGNLNTSDSIFDRTFIKPTIDKITDVFLNRIIGNTGFNKLENVDQKPRACYGIARLQIPHYDDGENEQRYRPIQYQVVFANDKINGVDEFTDSNYVVMLQPIDNKVIGEAGRSFAAYSVHSKTTTGFKVCYEEGVTPEAFGDNLENVGVTLAWFARGH